MSFATGYEQLDDFIISGLISEQLKVNDDPEFLIRRQLRCRRESRSFKFRSTAKRVVAPLDTRFLVFEVEDFKMTEM